jgi:hypothetical protein
MWRSLWMVKFRAEDVGLHKENHVELVDSLLLALWSAAHAACCLGLGPSRLDVLASLASLLDGRWLAACRIEVFRQSGCYLRLPIARLRSRGSWLAALCC